MKILHTSDWHLNEKLGQVDRQPDLCERLKEIAGYLDQERVDVMLVSGDLFSNIARVVEVRSAVSDVSEIFRPYLLRGGTIVAISGNHDSEDLFNLFREAMNLAAPQDIPPGSPKPSGRMYLYESWNYIRLADQTGQEVQFVLLPYPTPSRYLRDDQLGYKTIEERNRKLRDELLRRLNFIKAKHIQPQLPTVLMSHLHVRGNHLHNLYRLSEAQDVVFDPIDLPMEWAYIACGHIHLPQEIPGNARARFAGSIERLDFSEAEDQKSVVLVEIGRGGLQGDPILLPLNSTPMYKIEIHNMSEVARLEEQYPDARRAIVDYRVIYKPGGDDNPDAIRDAIEQIFPRWCRRKVEIEGADRNLALVSSDSTSHPGNIHDTVRAYLQERLAKHADRDDLLVLAEELLATI